MPAGSPFMALRLVDSLSGRPTAVRATSRGRVGLYVCGPTVYDAAHVGHARTYLLFDVARRVLEAEGFAVRHVMNITDVEDKIDERAAALGLSSHALARAEERSFLRDMAAFGNRPPAARPRASAYVPEMRRIAQALERTGRVHREGDEWRYDAPERPEGGNFLSGEELARHAVAEPEHPFGDGADGPRSFVVWKRQEAPRPSWPSRWGRGAPGWHLQCFAMASEDLSLPVDLHGGGRDLLYPHHFAENEISFALRRRRFARVFLHPGLVLENGAKMSKSRGNLAPLRAALDEMGRGALRWHLLSRPYRERFPWDAAAARRAAEEYALVRSAVAAWLRSHGGNARSGAGAARRAAREVRSELLRDLGTERAVARLRGFVAQVGRAPGGLPAGERSEARAALGQIERRLGLALA